MGGWRESGNFGECGCIAGECGEDGEAGWLAALDIDDVDRLFAASAGPCAEECAPPSDAWVGDGRE